MITVENFKDLLIKLSFSQEGGIFSKYFPDVDAYLRVDFHREELIYPEDKGLKVNERQVCNFKAHENFVVFECVHRLLEKGYKPQHIELEPRWKVGHGASGGRADILVRGHDSRPLLIIECKTWGNEFANAWKNTLNGKGQLFTYAHQERSTKYLCLYASGWEDKELKYVSYVIALRDNDDIIKRKAAENPPTYRDADSAKALYEAWKYTYESDYATRGIFEPDVQPYQIGKAKYTVADLRTVTEKDIQPKYHEFATILRQHNISGRENAFDKLVNLFLCKIVDEKHNPDDLQFYWRGIAFDSYFDLIDRLQRLYRDGMQEFLKEEVTYIDDQTIRDAFKFFRDDPDATRDKILDYFRRQKYFTNSDFSFLDVHNEQLFYQNAAVLLKIVRMLQDIRLTGDQEKNQFLGDMFEFFLDQGFKQTEGQFFTPLPVVRFIILSLPLETLFKDEESPPKVIDYACGAGHFLTELASQLRRLKNDPENKLDMRAFYRHFYGIEKEYRLSKVAKVSAFMYNQDEINVIYADALVRHPDIPEGKFALLISNPPYSVKGFLETLPEMERHWYELIKTVDPKSYPTNSAIEAFFVERARQLLAPNGIAAIIVPSSVLSNRNAVYVRTREIILQYFDVLALVELGKGTFAKTGTNTVILFLRRKDDNPEPHLHYLYRVDSLFGDEEGRKKAKTNLFSDANLLTAYCQHIGISEDDYKTLLNGAPNDALLQSAMFQEYRRAFDANSKVKKKGGADEGQAGLEKPFIEFVRTNERKKLYYFILAHTQACPVVVVRSPQDTDEMRKFLGYEWSSARGQEGIKYPHGSIERIETPLFDPKDRNNPEKISTLIRQNFQGNPINVPESLRPYVTVVRLVDLLDFSRVSFDSQISLVPEIKVKTRYEERALGELCDVIKGVSYSKSDEVDTRTENAILTADNITLSGRLEIKKIVYLKPEIEIKQEKRLRENDIFICFSSGSLEHLGKVAFIDSDTPYYAGGFMGILRPKNSESVLPKYLYEVLNSERFRDIVRSRARGANIKNLSNSITQIKIPVPPREVQENIVKRCQEIDAETEKARAKVEDAQKQLTKMVGEWFSRFRMSKIDSVCSLEYGKSLPKGKRTFGDYPVVGSNGIDGYHNEFLIEGPAVIIGRKGSAGVVNYVKENCYPIDTTYYVKPKIPVNMKYLYYVLSYLELDKKIKKGTGVPGVDRNDIYQLEIPLPSKTEQDALIAEVEKLEKVVADARIVIDSASLRKQEILEAVVKGGYT